MPDYGSFTDPAGVATDRITKLRSQIQLYLGTMNGNGLSNVMENLPSQIVYDVIQRGQTVLAEEFLCIEKSTTVTFTSSVGSEPSGFYRLKQLVLGSGESLQPVEIDVQEYDQLTRSIYAAGIRPFTYFRWNGSITIYPSITDGSYTIYYYGTPTTTVAVAVNPETPAYMDEALLYFALKELSQIAERPDLVMLYEGKWEVERERVRGSWMRSKSIRNVIHYHDL